MGTVNEQRYAGRRRAAMRSLAGAKVDGMVISRPADVTWLTGFTGDSTFLIMKRRWACLITDGRYTEQAEREAPGVELYTRKRSLQEATAGAVRGRGIRRLGVQADHLTVTAVEAFRKALGVRRVRPVADRLGQLRSVKDPGEIRAIRKAVRIAEAAFRDLIGRGARGLIGKTEREIAAELDYRMRCAGAEAAAFETIVAVGTHTSLPHYRPAGRKAAAGQPVLIDWGACVGGYRSDLTRVVFLDRIPPRLGEIYEVVRKAQAAGIAALRAGVWCRTADAAARAVIGAAGYEERFAHGLGHGVGLEVHEWPGMGRKAKTRLRAGMVVTVEPGIYVPGLGGVRLEDDVQVLAGRPRRLSTLPRDLSAMLLR